MITLIAGMVKNTFSAMSEKVMTFPLTAFWMYIGVQPQKNETNRKIICFNK